MIFYMESVEILILGLGFIGAYVQKQCIIEDIVVASTTTTGRNNSIKFSFSNDLDCKAYEVLPPAKSILITFPMKPGSPEKFLKCYRETHFIDPKIILLGSTGSFKKTNTLWHDRNGPMNQTDERIIAENGLMKVGGCVLNLAGLWGGVRNPKNWISRVAATKSSLEDKGSLHLIHGADVARLIISVFKRFTSGCI